MKLTHRCTIAAPAEKVMDALASEAYNLEAERGREGVVSTVFRETSRSPMRVAFELRTIEYRRTKTGSIDRSGTFVSVTRSELDRARKVLTWAYDTESGRSRVKLSGVYRMRDIGPATELEHEVVIDVDIPLVGGAIAKLIARSFESGLQRYDDQLRRHAGAPG